jgi:Carboxypeptidase regulatory-like domain
MPRRNDISKVLAVTGAVVLLATYAFGCTDIRQPKAVGPVFTVFVTGSFGPQANMDITLQPQSGGRIHKKQSARTDRRGVAMFRDVPEGQYELSTSRAGMRDFWPVEVHAAGDHVSRVDLTWPSPRMLRVREIAGSIHRDDAPDADREMELENAAGETIWAGRTGSKGTFRGPVALADGLYELKLTLADQTADYIPIEITPQAKAATLDVVAVTSSCGLMFTNLEDCNRPSVQTTTCGVVHDGSGAAIANAAIVAYDGVHRIASTTDRYGKFTLDNLAPGQYEVLVSAAFFTPLRATMTVDHEVTTCASPVNIEMSMVGSCSSVRQRGAKH